MLLWLAPCFDVRNLALWEVRGSWIGCAVSVIAKVPSTNAVIGLEVPRGCRKPLWSFGDGGAPVRRRRYAPFVRGLQRSRRTVVHIWDSIDDGTAFFAGVRGL